LCTDIFHHVFTEGLPEEMENSNNYRNLELKLGYVLYHLKENESNVKGIIAADVPNDFFASSFGRKFCGNS